MTRCVELNGDRDRCSTWWVEGYRYSINEAHVNARARTHTHIYKETKEAGRRANSADDEKGRQPLKTGAE